MKDSRAAFKIYEDIIRLQRLALEISSICDKSIIHLWHSLPRTSFEKMSKSGEGIFLQEIRKFKERLEVFDIEMGFSKGYIKKLLTDIEVLDIKFLNKRKSCKR